MYNMLFHYSVVIMTGVSIVYSTVCSGGRKKYQHSASLAFVRASYRWPVDFSHKRPIMRKMFEFYGAIMFWAQVSWEGEVLK